MAIIPDITKFFMLTAKRLNGTPIEGAHVRILNANWDEVTNVLFGKQPIYTDNAGIVFAPFFNGSGLPFGQTYSIHVSAPGFLPWSATTSTAWNGKATYIATLELVTENPSGSYTINEPVNKPLSNMVPIECSVETTSAYQYEYINATVTHPDDSSSIIQAPIDGGYAEFDLRNRVQLGIRPLLVADADLTRPDADFSTKIDVTFTSVHPEGEAPVDGTFSRLVAHTLPPDGKSDLGDYTSLNNQLWIVPAEPVIAFKGYYRDVMFWLPVPSLAGYSLRVQFYNYAGVLSQTVNSELTASDYVQRLRLNTNPDSSYAKCVLTILAGANPVSRPLTVLYRD